MNVVRIFQKHGLLIVKLLICAEILYSSAHAKTCQNYTAFPYAKQIKQSKLPKKQKDTIAQMWGTLYAMHHARIMDTTDYGTKFKSLKSGKTKTSESVLCTDSLLSKDSKKLQNLELCLDKSTKPVNDVNCTNNMKAAHALLSPAVFAQAYEQFEHQLSAVQVPNDTTGVLSKYATFHLARAAKRFGSICSISVKDNEPKATCSGDVRDLGVIVNIQNNSKSEFEIHQRTVDGNSSTVIGSLVHGMNTPNLHTAALQAAKPKGDLTKVATQTEHYFELIPTNGSENKNISIRFYKGSELVDLLKTLHRKDPKLFEMNGLPTSEQHLTEKDDWYLVITQALTPSSATTRNPDQRIQAINVSKLTGPYLLTLQINEAPIPHKENGMKIANGAIVVPSDTYADGKPVPKMFQPSFVTAQVIQRPMKDKQVLPLMILPHYLWTMPELQLQWMQITTLYLAALTDFEFYGKDTFGSAFEYFKGMGYFSTDYEYTFFIDKGNLVGIGERLLDASWLITCAIYETSLTSCNDLFLLYLTQDSKGGWNVNAEGNPNVNFLVEINSREQEKANLTLFQTKGFNDVYNMSYHCLWTLLFNMSASYLKEGVFAKVIKVDQETYQLLWKNKSGDILSEKIFNIYNKISDIKVKFVTNQINWAGTVVPHSLIQSDQKDIVDFTVIYEINSESNKHILLSQQTTPIDKVQVIHTVDISEHLTDLYYDVYKKIKVAPYTRCYVFNENKSSEIPIIPKPIFLEKLIDQDWKDGIYVIASVKNNEEITEKNHGALTVAFYKSDRKTLLGEATIKGDYNNTEAGIRTPVYAYNLYSTQFNTLFDVWFSTGIFLKLVEK